MDRRFRRHDEVSDEHGNGDQQPAVALMGGNALPQEAAHRHEAHVDTGKEQHQPDVGVQQTKEHTHDLPPVHPPGDQLEQDEKRQNGRQRQEDLLEILRQRMGIRPEHLRRVLGIRHAHRGIGAAVGLIQQAQQQYRDDGADGTQGHQTEAVAPRLPVVTHGADAHAQRHDKGYRHGAGGDAAGVEGDGPEVRGHEARQHEHDGVKPDQQIRQLDGKQNTQQGDHQKNPHAQRHGPDDDPIRDRRHLPCQHLQIRLRHGDDDADQKADGHDDPHLFGSGDLLTYRLTQWDHGHLRTQSKQPHTHDQQQTPQQKRHHGVVGDRGNSKAQHQHNGGDGQHRGQRFLQGLAENGQHLSGLPPLAPQAILLRLYAQWLTRQISSSFSNFLLTKRERTCPHIGQMRLASLLTISFYHEKPPQGKGFSVKNP